jgi:hypothetical protein
MPHDALSASEECLTTQLYTTASGYQSRIQLFGVGQTNFARIAVLVDSAAETNCVLSPQHDAVESINHP